MDFKISLSQKCFGILEVNTKALATTNRCLFFTFGNLVLLRGFNKRALVDYPMSVEEIPIFLLKYSMQLPVHRIWMSVWNWVCIIKWKLTNTDWTSEFSFNKYTQQIWVLIINEHNKPLCMISIRNAWRTPYVTANYSKWFWGLIWGFWERGTFMFSKLTKFTLKVD